MAARNDSSQDTSPPSDHLRQQHPYHQALPPVPRAPPMHGVSPVVGVPMHQSTLPGNSPPGVFANPAVTTTATVPHFPPTLQDPHIQSAILHQNSVPPTTANPSARARLEPFGAAADTNPITLAAATADRALQRFLDRLAPHKLYRWLFLVALFALFVLRMLIVQGFYIVTYVLLIFLLNQFILFVQPKDRASLIARRRSMESGDDSETAAPALPTLDADEFRPFVRRLPEFKFWYSATVATFLSICATFFEIFDIPVFWPVLVFYFVVLFVATMRRQWLDMKQLKYVPWDIGNKKTYKSDPKKVSVAPRDAASLARAAMDSASTSIASPGAPRLPNSPGVATAAQKVRRGSPASDPVHSQ